MTAQTPNLYVMHNMLSDWYTINIVNIQIAASIGNSKKLRRTFNSVIGDVSTSETSELSADEFACDFFPGQSRHCPATKILYFVTGTPVPGLSNLLQLGSYDSN